MLVESLHDAHKGFFAGKLIIGAVVLLLITGWLDYMQYTEAVFRLVGLHIPDSSC